MPNRNMNVTLIDPFIWISVIRTKITRKIKINWRHDFYLFPPKNEILLYNHKWNLGNSISGTFLFSLSLAVRNNNFFLEEIKRAWNHRSNRNLLFASRSPQVSTMRVKKYCFAESFLAEDASPLRGKKIARLWSRGTLRVLEEVVIKAIVSGPIVIFSLLEVAIKINAVIDPCLSCLLFPIHFLVFLNVTRVWLVYFDPWSLIDILAVLNIVHII